MSYIASVAEAQALLQQKSGAGRTASAGAGTFFDTLKNGLAGITESMDAIFQEAASRYHLPEGLLKAVAKAESNFDPKAVSHAGAMGVMQLMPGTAKSLGVTDPYDARQNIMGGAKYLKENLDRFGDVSLALAAYNAGPNRVQQYGGIPPYQETQNYVKKVMTYMGEPTLSAGRMVATGSGGSSYYGSLSTLPTVLGSGSGYGYGIPMSELSMGSGSGSGGIGGSSGYGSVLSALSLGSGSGSSGIDSSGSSSYASLLAVLSALGSGGDGGSMLSLAALPNQMFTGEEEDGAAVDQETVAGLIQLMRIQMMMNADREVGVIEL